MCKEEETTMETSETEISAKDQPTESENITSEQEQTEASLSVEKPEAPEEQENAETTETEQNGQRVWWKKRIPSMISWAIIATIAIASFATMIVLVLGN